MINTSAAAAAAAVAQSVDVLRSSKKTGTPRHRNDRYDHQGVDNGAGNGAANSNIDNFRGMEIDRYQELGTTAAAVSRCR